MFHNLIDRLMECQHCETYFNLKRYAAGASHQFLCKISRDFKLRTTSSFLIPSQSLCFSSLSLFLARFLNLRSIHPSIRTTRLQQTLTVYINGLHRCVKLLRMHSTSSHFIFQFILFVRSIQPNDTMGKKKEKRTENKMKSSNVDTFMKS